MFDLVADAEQRRLGDVDVAAFDQLVHLAVEEREQQRADVRAVDVGVGHDDDAAVAALGEVLVFADAGADGGDHAADFLVGEDLVFARFVGVDDLAAQGEDGLVLAHAAAFGAAAGRVAFHEVELALVDVAAGAVAELAGQAAAGEGAFAFADELLLLAGGDAGLGGEEALVADRLGGLGVLFEELGEVLAEERVDDAFDFAVAELGLGLAFELRMGHAATDDGGEAFAEIFAGGDEVFEEAAVLAVVVDAAGEGGAEAGEVRAAFGGVDVVDVGVDVLGVLGRVLQGDFDGDAVALAFDVEDVGVDRLAGAVEVLDVFAEAVVVLERFLFAGAVVGDGDAHALVEEGELLHALLQRGVDELGGREDLRIGLEGGLGAALGGVADAADVGLGDAALVFLVVDVAVAADFDLAPFGEEVDDGDADAVQAAGGLVGALFELAAELEDGHHAFERGDVAADFFGELGVPLDGDAAAVVFDGDASRRR